MKTNLKMNKYIFGGLILAGLLGTTTACDPLGMEPTTKVDEDRFWENSQLARSYVNNFYTWSVAASGQNFQAEQWSDNCQGNYEQDWTTYRQLNFNNRQYDENSGNGVFTAPWDDAYKKIRAVNLGIEKVSGSTALTEELKNQLLGECYFFRAFVYFDMEKYWGAVPYVDKAMTLEDESFLPQTKRETLFDNMLADLDKANGYFANVTEKPTLGMVNADVVNAFKSRVALYAANAADASAKGIYADDAKGLFKFEKNAASYYEIAYNAAKAVIGKYTLEPEYETLFTSEAAHTSTESIWPVMFKLSLREGFNPTSVNGPDGYYYGNNEEDTPLEWSFRSGLFPTQDLVDCYLQKDEVDGKWKNWWETAQAKRLNIVKRADGEFEGSGADYRDIFKNRDKRFYATVTYDGSYMGPEEERYQIQTWIDNSTAADNMVFKYSALHTGYREVLNLKTAPINRGSAQTITGYYSRKYSHFDDYFTDGTLNKQQRTTCYFNIRYAEVLLNCAEAGIKLGMTDAEGYINEIRNRAGLDNFDATAAGHDLYEEMKLQRRLEFAFENPGFRYYDLLRWGEAEGKTVIDELNKPSRGLWIFRKGIESEKQGENGYPADPSDPKYFTPHFETAVMDYAYYQRKFDNARYYFMPYGITTLTSYKELQQNPGWKDFKYND